MATPFVNGLEDGVHEIFSILIMIYTNPFFFNKFVFISRFDAGMDENG